LAEVCSARIRTVDLLYRYGGEEFTLLLPRTGVDEAAFIAERLRNFVERTPLMTDAGSIDITLSLGVAELSDQHGSIAALIDAADAAMYRAKKLGRNQVRHQG
jgi:diguanylate cyclase (GGDEF)-like protein